MFRSLALGIAFGVSYLNHNIITVDDLLRVCKNSRKGLIVVKLKEVFNFKNLLNKHSAQHWNNHQSYRYCPICF